VDVVPYTASDAATLLEACRGAAPRVVAVSSGDVYKNYGVLLRAEPGPPDPAPLAEDAPVRTRLFPYRAAAKGPDDLAYGYEKLLVERAVLASREPAGTVLRLPMLYGPGDRQRRLLPVLARAARGRPVVLGRAHARWRVSYGYVEDAAAAVAAAALDARAAGETLNVGEADAPAEAERAREIGAAAGVAVEVVEVPDGALPSEARFDYAAALALDTGKLRRLLGFEEPVGRADGLSRTVEWERSAGSGLHAPPGLFDDEAEDAALSLARYAPECG